MKRHGCGHTHDVGRGLFTKKKKKKKEKKTDEKKPKQNKKNSNKEKKHGCMDTQEVLRVNLKATYDEG